MLDLEILERAQDDIYRMIAYGVETHGEPAARAYVEKVRERIDWLRANAKLGPVHSQLKGGIRSYSQGRHRIYYIVDARKLTVVRVLHQSMDVGPQFM